MSIRKQLLVGAALFLLCTTVACGQAKDRAAASPQSSDMAVSADAGIAYKQMAPMEEADTSGREHQIGGKNTVGQQVNPSPPQPQLASLLSQRSVIRKAEIAVRVDNVEKGERAVNEIVAKLGGYVDSAQSADLASANPTIDISLRIPVAQFDNTLEKFESLGVRMSKTVSSEDVTGQIVDLDARLKTMQAQEETYRNLLRAARQLDNVITLQDKLTEVRGEIESLAAQRKTLGGLAAFSTISVHLQQSAAPVAPPTDPNWFGQVWGESTTTLGIAGRALTSFLVWLAVFSPFWAPVLVVAWRLARPRKPTRVA